MGLRAAGGGSAAGRRWRHRLRHDGVVLAPVLAVTLWYFHPLLMSADVIYGGLDITRQFYLFKQAAVAEIQAGHMPLWLSTVYCGMPLLGALIDTPFHPWDLLAAALRVPVPVIFNVGLLLHLLLGQIGAYVWVRQDSPRRLPAVLAACWIWNPFILNSIASGDHNNVRAMLLVPAILAALERGLDGKRFRRPWLAYGLLQALQIMCSGLQFAFYTCVLGGLTALVTLWYRRGKQPVAEYAARVRWWLIGSLLAVTIPMVQLLPGLQFSSYSVRGNAEVAWSSVWGVPPGLLLSFVAPFVDRGSHILMYWGIAPLVFAGIGIWAWRRPRRMWCIAVLVVSLILCIGSDWAVSGWLNDLPVLRRFRGPFRVALFANLMIVRLAAGGVTATLTYFEEQRHGLLWRVAVRRTTRLLAVGAVLALIWWPQSRFFDSWQEVLPTAVTWGLTAAAVGAMVRVRQAWVVGLVLATAPADWAVHLGRYWTPHSLAAFQADATVGSLVDQAEATEPFRIWLRNTPSANYLGLFGLPSVAGHHAFPLARAARFVRGLDLHDGRLLRLSQTRHVLTYSGRADGALGPPIRTAQEVEVRTVRGELVPRVRVVGAGRWLRTGTAVWDAMQAGNWNPAANLVLLEGPADRTTYVGRGGTAQIVDETAGTRTIDVTSDGPGYLVVADTWYEGWRATVNSATTPVLRANYLFQAVAVPSGTARVELRFSPPVVRIGLFTSMLGVLCWLTALGLAQYREGS